MHNRYRTGLAIAVAIGALQLAGCNSGSLISTQQEVDVGRRSAAKIESRHQIVRNSADARRVQTIGRRVAAVSDRKDVTYDIELLNTNSINAIALPGGWVYIYDRLVNFVDRQGRGGGGAGLRGDTRRERRADALDDGRLTRRERRDLRRDTRLNNGTAPLTSYPTGSDDVLAAVIAHEVGHVSARHSAKMMGRSAMYGIALGALSNSNTEQWANFFAGMDMLRYSRDDEYEADRLGMIYAQRAGYNPWGMVTFLEMLDTKYPDSANDIEQLTRTHPTTPDRIERARALAGQLGGTRY